MSEIPSVYGQNRFDIENYCELKDSCLDQTILLSTGILEHHDHHILLSMLDFESSCKSFVQEQDSSMFGNRTFHQASGHCAVDDHASHEITYSMPTIHRQPLALVVSAVNQDRDSSPQYQVIDDYSTV